MPIERQARKPSSFIVCNMNGISLPLKGDWILLYTHRMLVEFIISFGERIVLKIVCWLVKKLLVACERIMSVENPMTIGVH